MKRPGTIGVVLAAALGVAAATYGRGANGDELADSRNCRELLDVSLDLYELCAAYCYSPCNAMDLEEPCLPSDAEILERYNALRGPGDPPMPCVRGRCPCFNAEDLRQIRREFQRQSTGERRPFSSFGGPRLYPTCYRNAEHGDFEDTLLLTERNQYRRFFATTRVDSDGVMPSACALYLNAPLSVQAVTQSELAACNDLLKSRADELRLMCRVPLPSGCERTTIGDTSGICFTNELDVHVRVRVLSPERVLRSMQDLAPRSEPHLASAFASVPARRGSWTAIVEDGTPLCSGEIVLDPRPSQQTFDQIRIGPELGCEVEP